MDAWIKSHVAFAMIGGLFVALAGSDADAADYRTQNFIIQAPTPGLAKSVGDAAERYRHDLAIYWLDQELPAWPSPCPIRVVAGPKLAAQGVTTYNPRPVRDFQMEVIGTPERILDSVLPHEVTHTVLATHFGRPLPRWADEGICTTVEHVSERNKHEAKLREFLGSRRGIAMNRLFLLTEYPSDVLPMYAQGYSVCRFLIDQQGPQAFIAFLHDYIQHPSWTDNIRKHYGYQSLANLQEYWLAWVESGSGPVDRFTMVAGHTDASISATGAVVQASLADVQSASSAGAPQGEMALASNNVPLTAPGVPLVPDPGTAVASLSSTIPSSGQLGRARQGTGSWYQRRRADVARQGVSGKRQSVRQPPPAVGDSTPYRSAQPQPEQKMSRGGQSAESPGASHGSVYGLSTSNGVIGTESQSGVYTPRNGNSMWR